MKAIILLVLYGLMCQLCFSQQLTSPVLPGSVTVLPANNAAITNGLRPTPVQDLDKDPKVFAIQGWKDTGQTFTWQAAVVEKGAYQVAILVQVKGLSPTAQVTLELSSPTAKVSVQTTNTGWNKLFFPGSLLLHAGQQPLQLKLAAIPAGEQPDINVYSIELGTEKNWQKNAAAAESLRSKPAWLTEAKYGLFFHWNAMSKPRTGPAKNYVDAVQDFDVAKFAAMVHETGADFIVLTTSWHLFTFPAPLKSVDNILPGNTTPRDLIADLSTALAKWNIKLMVYCNFRINKMGWNKAYRFKPENDSVFIKLLSIYREIGQRYAHKICGLWIDDGMGLYAYNAPFETLARSIKQFDKQLVVGYNSWIYPRFTDFQDFYGGEKGITMEAARVNEKELPAGGTGYFISGGQQGLKATFCGLLESGDWTHTETDLEIPPPLLTSEALNAIIHEAMRRKNVAIMNVRVYQDGSISPRTFELLKQLNKSVHP